MIKLLILVSAIAVGTATAGLVAATAPVYPALGAPLVGKVTYNAAETTVVKQPVVVDQHVVRHVPVPTVVQAAPVVRTVQPVVHAPAPAVVHAAAPAVTYAAAGVPAFNPAFGYSAIW